MNKCFINRIAMFTFRGLGWFDVHFTKELIGGKDVMQAFELISQFIFGGNFKREFTHRTRAKTLPY